VNLLLDTHTLLWWLNDDPRLSEAARSRITDPEATVFVSAASAWEASSKLRLGKLSDSANAVPRLSAIIRERGMTELPIGIDHGVLAGSLPGPHRDPFDRMLIAQARIEGLPVVTSDPVFRAYDVPVIW